MIVFHADLDNTLMYSHKRDIGTVKRCCEIYNDKEISFITDKTYELLKQVNGKVLLVPTTTRTMEQYNRIDFGIPKPRYVLTCNGGILLVDGEVDETWYQDSLKLIKESEEQLAKAVPLLAKEPTRSFEVRFIKDLFLFTKCDDPEQAIAMLKEKLDSTLVDVFHNGIKLYVVPKKLSKGMAVKRFRTYMPADVVIAAGDSLFDVSMIQAADVSYAPEELSREQHFTEKTMCVPDTLRFSEEILAHILELVQ